MRQAKTNKIMQRVMMTAVLTIGLLFTGTSQATVVFDHEYYAITLARVEKALADGAEKKDIKLAEASLTALGWMQLYANDSASADLAKRLNEVVTKAYNGTDKMDTIYMKHTSDAYFEMLNLKRFTATTPFSCSPEYAKITRQRVEKALSEGAGADDIRLAEGSLCALGWMDLFGNDSKSLEKAKTMMNAASKAWPGANEVYMLQTIEAYAEMINLGRFKHGDCGALSQPAQQRLTLQQLEEEFRTCAEAQQHGASTDLDFTTSLYWRYLGKGPDGMLQAHAARLKK